MPNLRGRYVVETDWLATHLDAPDLVVLDGSWHLPAAGRSAKAEFAAERIPRAQFFDIDDISDETSPLPHMLPSTVKFASRMKKMGIGDGMRIVVYDTNGMFSAPRVWWTFRAMGHEDVAVLNGGLAKWKREGRPTTSEPPAPRSERHFTPRVNAAIIRDRDDVSALLSSKAEQIVDARSPGRFAGRDPEPRAGLRSGHIPGSRNLFYTQLLNPDGTLKAPDELHAAFRAAGVDPSRPITTTCGSGVTASILALALALLGNPNAAVYDGSWTEWGQSGLDTPVTTGDAT